MSLIPDTVIKTTADIAKLQKSK